MQLTDEHRQLAETVARFVETEINPHVDAWEEAEEFPAHEVFAKLGANSACSASNTIPNMAGLGLDFSYSMVMAEELGAVHCGGVPMAIGVQTDMCTPALNRFGSDECEARIAGAGDRRRTSSAASACPSLAAVPTSPRSSTRPRKMATTTSSPAPRCGSPTA